MLVSVSLPSYSLSLSSDVLCIYAVYIVALLGSVALLVMVPMMMSASHQMHLCDNFQW